MSNIIIIIFVLIIVAVALYYYYDCHGHKSFSQPFITSDDHFTVSHDNLLAKKKKKKRTINNIGTIDVDMICDQTGKCKIKLRKPKLNVQADEPVAYGLLDRVFDQPLIREEEKEKYFDKLRQKHNEYGTALCDHAQYQTDNNIQLEQIDPICLRDSEQAEKLHGKTIGDIYDALVNVPKDRLKKYHKQI